MINVTVDLYFDAGVSTLVLVQDVPSYVSVEGSGFFGPFVLRGLF